MLTRNIDSLTRYMRAADCSQARLARHAGCSRQFVHQLVKGQVPGCSDEVAAKIEDFLGVLPGTLFMPSRSRATGRSVA